MLIIKLLPTSFIVSGLSDEYAAKICGPCEVKPYELKPGVQGHRVKGKPNHMYALLLELSCTFDIELT